MIKNKVWVFIQARLSSTRLPWKVLMKLSWREVLNHIVDRCLKWGFNKSNIFILTSNEKSDDTIELFCKNNSINCFRWSLNNVLERFYQCWKKNWFEYIFRLTWDNPLSDINIEQLKFLKKTNKNYLYINERWTLWTWVELIKFSELEEAYINSIDKQEQEHVTSYTRKKNIDFEIKNSSTNYRLTIDEDKDFKLLSLLFDKFYKKWNIINIDKIIKYLDKNKKLELINSEIKQKNIK